MILTLQMNKRDHGSDWVSLFVWLLTVNTNNSILALYQISKFMIVTHDGIGCSEVSEVYVLFI